MANHRAKVCRALADFLGTFPVVDSFRFCHPQDREYTFIRPGVAPSLMSLGPICPWWERCGMWLSLRTHSALYLSFKGSLSVSLPPFPLPPSHTGSSMHLW
jgi:hypothetical protein